MTVLIESDRSLVELFQSALGGGSTVLDSHTGLEGYLAGHQHEYAVVLGPSVTTEVAVEIADRLRITRPATGVILVRGRIDSSILAEALRSGMREVVESRDLTGLGDAVRRAHQLHEAMAASAPGREHEVPAEQTGRLFTVFSTKGGVGKTTIATNLGAVLADQGRNVCLVDLDIQSGDVAIMLQLFPSRTLSDLLNLRGAIDAAGITSLLTEHSPGLSVLAAPLQIDAHESIAADDVARALAVLKTMFDVVVVDTSGSFDDHVLNAFDHSDLVLLVGTLDIPALKNLKLATSTLDLLNIPRRQWRLVLNRADTRVGLSNSEFAETLGVDIAVAFPSSREVLAAVNRGEAIVRAHPKHPVSQSFAAFARTLVGDGDRTDESSQTTERTGRRRRLRRVH